MTSRAWLSDQQKRRAARIARGKGLSLLDCGSSEPVPGDEARAHPGGGADVVMQCVNSESAYEMTLVLSPEEAKALGLGQGRQDDLRGALRTSHDHAFASSPSALLHDRCTSTPPATGRSSLIRSFSCKM